MSMVCGFGLLVLLTWNKADAVPMPDDEVYESMSAE
jgi:hypothetical protein